MYSDSATQIAATKTANTTAALTIVAATDFALILAIYSVTFVSLLLN